MIIQKQPDYLIFADSAKKGENAEFPDISRGWGITVEQTASKPPMEWMNGAFNRVDKNILYLLQQGVPEWNDKVTYPINAIIKYNGVLYTAIVENDNAVPSTGTTKWKKTQAEISLSSAVDSKSTEIAANSLAVKTVNDKIEDVKKIYQYDESETRFYSPDGKMRFVVRNDGISGIYSSSLNDAKGGFIWSFNEKGELNGKLSVDNIIGLSNYIYSKIIFNSETNSTITTEAATPAAVKTVNDNANSAHQRITAVHNIVIGITDKFQFDDFESRVYSPDKSIHYVIRDDGICGVFDKSKKQFSWYFSPDGLLTGYIDSSRVVGLDQFVRDRTIPAGVPLPWPQITPPPGYFECNGSQFNTTQFPRLATAYPSGYLPDLRGEFIRGWDHGRGADPNREILSWQQDAIRNIWGTFMSTDDNGVTVPTGAFRAIEQLGMGSGGSQREWKIQLDASAVVPTSHDNHPRSIAFMMIVKAE